MQIRFDQLNNFFMELRLLFLRARMNALILLLILSFSPHKITQTPLDFHPLNLSQPTDTASTDFGRILFNPPSSVLKPKTPKDISLLLSFLSTSSSFSQVSVSARGAGHSIHGQAQALDGIVIEMGSLSSDLKFNKNVRNGEIYVDVCGGALWIEVLKESLKLGFAPRSYTDYLYLTVGGTLSNGGISGQTFKYGPQISNSNVLQLDVVTGKGEMVTCSPTENTHLFNSVLGGLGQFGIITRARIMLQIAPKKVRWVRVFYDDFAKFTNDEEKLVLMPELVDYVEGFLVLNEKSLHSSSIAFPTNLNFNPSFIINGIPKIYYCIEFVIHDYQLKDFNTEQVVDGIARNLNFMQSHLYSVEVSYFDFLNRVKMEEESLRRKGLWDVPHPWLNMLVPKSSAKDFMDLLMENISLDEFDGPILIYPLLRDKWNVDTSMVLPPSDESESNQIMYVVGILRSVNPLTCNTDCLNNILHDHRYVAKTATESHIGARQYLAHHQSAAEWRDHFGPRWTWFAEHKARFDPLHILGPGQGIFPRISVAI